MHLLQVRKKKVMSTMAAKNLLFLTMVGLTCALAVASDPSSLQDFCVADLSSSFVVNGLVCMNPTKVQAEHFSFSGLDLPAMLTPFGFGATSVTVNQVPGLNTMGISIARVDYAPQGVATPHVHQRATEMLTVLEGNLLAGFVSSSDGRLISKVLSKGDVFVFPIGLVHFQQNVGNISASSISAFSSQDIGTVLVANNVFGSKPLIPTDVLTKAFQVGKDIVAEIEAKF